MDLIAAGHRWQDLRDDYTIAQLRLFSEALAVNREMRKLDQAEGVVLGIEEAFRPEAQVISKLRRALATPNQTVAPANPLANPALAWFAGLPIKGN